MDAASGVLSAGCTVERFQHSRASLGSVTGSVEFRPTDEYLSVGRWPDVGATGHGEGREPSILLPFSARLKLCPFTKSFMNHAVAGAACSFVAAALQHIANICVVFFAG